MTMTPNETTVPASEFVNATMVQEVVENLRTISDRMWIALDIIIDPDDIDRDIEELLGRSGDLCESLATYLETGKFLDREEANEFLPEKRLTGLLLRLTEKEHFARSRAITAVTRWLREARGEAEPEESATVHQQNGAAAVAEPEVETERMSHEFGLTVLPSPPGPWARSDAARWLSSCGSNLIEAVQLALKDPDEKIRGAFSDLADDLAILVYGAGCVVKGDWVGYETKESDGRVLTLAVVAEAIDRYGADSKHEFHDAISELVRAQRLAQAKARE